MSEDHSTERINQTSVSHWDSDNLGDLIAEGVVHIDEVSLRAVEEEERKKACEEASQANAVYDDPDWEPPYTVKNPDF